MRRRRKRDEPHMHAVIENLMSLGAIKEVNACKNQFISSYFLVQKTNGKYRFVLNLKNLNKFISTSHFKMEDIRTALKLITEGCYMTSMDLKDAYFMISVHKDSRKFLRFIWEGKIFEYQCIPFGLNVAPWLYTKIMKPVINHLREKQFISVVYLDDWLCLGRSYDECLKNTNETRQILEELGFILNYDKCEFTPKLKCQFLGFVLNSEMMRIELPESKKLQILNFIRNLRNKKVCRIREFASLVGCITAACPAVRYGWLYSKNLERVKYLELRKNNDDYDALMRVPRSLASDFDWWEEKIVEAFNPIRQCNFVTEIFSDASRTGWGAACNGEVVYANWSVSELEYHINYLELLAAFNALKCFAEDKRDVEVLLRVDNTTAVSYINRMGGVQFPNLNTVTKMIWQFCELRNLWVFASYIASAENVEADRASRMNNTDTEWELASWAFSQIIEKFGGIDIDLFANKVNRKCARYCSWHQEADTFCVDAFTLKWTNFKFFAFPPFSMILRVLRKIKNDLAQGIVVAPYWPSQPWYPLWADMLLGHPIYFEPNYDLLISPCRDVRHPLASKMWLMAGMLSGRPLIEKE